MDAFKVAGFLINNPNTTRYNLFDNPRLKSLPIIAVPTIAGTGSKTKIYSIVTDNKLQIKHCICQNVFSKITLFRCIVTPNTMPFILIIKYYE